jgi:hypothetical protein
LPSLALAVVTLLSNLVPDLAFAIARVALTHALPRNLYAFQLPNVHGDGQLPLTRLLLTRLLLTSLLLTRLLIP